ncbi:hypothetical protein HW555_008200 [Spodoptera exigua]|uniref:Uncharacterized protein n=1 Tax=Spodoptera exigua TaxID=7107 RepID=A0A835GEF3_SPOEX|nr:hypothetical protein HW555_008200 [Spodoptera exigua]
MMLRTSIVPRIKIVYNDAAFVSTLRGTQWITAGKIKILPCAAVRKSLKSTKAPTIDVSETKEDNYELPVINKCSSKFPWLERKTSGSIIKKIYSPTADMDLIFDDYFHPHIQHNSFVNTTTAKEEKEQLAQKVEHVQETPLVEAQTQPIEGFNITPRVLGKLEQAYSWIKGNHIAGMSGEKSGDVDPNMDSSFGQLDETLLNELEKLGVPLTCDNEQTRSDDSRI